MSDPAPTEEPPVTDECPFVCRFNPVSTSKSPCARCSHPERYRDFYCPTEEGARRPRALDGPGRRFFKEVPSFHYVSRFLRELCIINSAGGPSAKTASRAGEITEMYYEELCIKRLKLRGVDLRSDLAPFVRWGGMKYLDGLYEHKKMLYVIQRLCDLYDVPIRVERRRRQKLLSARYYIDLPPEDEDLIPEGWEAPTD